MTIGYLYFLQTPKLGSSETPVKWIVNAKRLHKHKPKVVYEQVIFNRISTGVENRLRQPEQFNIWLHQIARRQCLDWRRKNKIEFCQLTDEILAEDSTIDELLILRETLAKVMQVIDELPEKELLKARYLDDSSYADLQAEHKLPSKTLVMRLIRAKQKVRERVKKVLAGIAVFPHQELLKSISIKGAELMKISLKTKIAVIVTTTFLVSGGTSVIVWYSHRSDKETSIQEPISETKQIASTKLNFPALSKKPVLNKTVDKPSLSQKERSEKAETIIEDPQKIELPQFAENPKEESPEELLARYTRITNSPEFRAQIDPIIAQEMEAGKEVEYKTGILLAKQKELENALTTASEEDRASIENELKKVKNEIKGIKINYYQKTIPLSYADMQIYHRYFTADELFDVSLIKMQKGIISPPVFPSNKEGLREMYMMREARKRLERNGYVPPSLPTPSEKSSAKFWKAIDDGLLPPFPSHSIFPDKDPDTE